MSYVSVIIRNCVVMATDIGISIIIAGGKVTELLIGALGKNNIGCLDQRPLEQNRGGNNGAYRKAEELPVLSCSL